MAQGSPIDCPFCGFNTDSEYQIMLHMETIHSEGGIASHFNINDDASIAAVLALEQEQEVQFSRCPVEGCGEELLWTELDSHIELHRTEQDIGENRSHTSKRIKLDSIAGDSFDAKLSYAIRNINGVDDDDFSSAHENYSEQEQIAKEKWKGLLNMPELASSKATSSKTAKKKLGVSNSFLGSMHHEILKITKKSQLGPHSDEKQMPAWLVKLLEADGEISSMNQISADGKVKKVKVCVNQSEGIIPVVEQLLKQDSTVDYAYLCHPNVRHVSKLKREGGFCGYRNIQTLCSHIIGIKSQGHEIFEGNIPTIFQIQDYIEHAWDLGINSQGRVETGGIRGTRKYIGTPDAQAMFCSLGISCDAQGLKSKRNSKDTQPNSPTPLPAYQLLFSTVEAYFSSGSPSSTSKIRSTNLPPLYFQHPGHSMTIIGFESRILPSHNLTSQSQTVSKNIIVFDPMFHDAAPIMKLAGQKVGKQKNAAELLKAYRRGVPYLKRYNEFELLKLTPPAGQRGEHLDGKKEEVNGI